MKNRWLGIFMVVTSAVLWGISGTVSQYLFSVSSISVACVVSIRMFTAGVLLILISIYKGHKKKVIDILKDKNSCINIIIYSIFGMLGVQFTYFTAIAASNAAIATLLQYLAPIIVIIFYIIRLKQKIKLSDEKRTLNPFELKKGLEKKLSDFFRLVNEYNKNVEQSK